MDFNRRDISSSAAGNLGWNVIPLDTAEAVKPHSSETLNRNQGTQLLELEPSAENTVARHKYVLTFAILLMLFGLGGYFYLTVSTNYAGTTDTISLDESAMPVAKSAKSGNDETDQAASAGGPGQQTTKQVTVYVSGAVQQPKVVELNPNQRVKDAIGAAGGFTSKANRAAVNLARKVNDGEQIHIPEQTAGTGQADAAISPGEPRKININQASSSQLQQLNGVGPQLAERIVKYRLEHGNFSSLNDLARVKGIGKKLLAEIKTDITL